jgi:lysophospholipase L1-like esterase
MIGSHRRPTTAPGRRTLGRRVLAAAAAAAVVAGIATVAGTASAEDFVPRLDWSMPDRVKTHISSGVVVNLTPSRKFINPDTWRVTLSGCGSSGDIIVKYQFDITLPDRVATVEAFGLECETFFDFPAEGTYPVTMTAFQNDGRTASTSRDVVVNDILIVSMGDSIASGEGNPDSVFGGGNADWYNRRCHRSGWSGAAQAAKKLENADKHTSVTFLSLGCSGAGIMEGVVYGYEGKDPALPNDKLPSQIEAAGGLLCPQDRECGSSADIRKPDGLILQVGANDVGFGDVVEACAGIAQQAGVIDDCDEDDDLILKLFRNKRDLPGKLDTMNEAVRAWLDPANIYVPDYPDPTIDDDNNICKEMVFEHPPIRTTITRKEATWATNEVTIPLNNMLLDASRRNGWQSLDFIQEGFARHGYCASQRYVVQYRESFLTQGDREGTMHPNRQGHEVFRDRLFTAMQPLIGS